MVANYSGTGQAGHLVLALIALPVEVSEVGTVAAVTIRNLDDSVKQKLRIRAAEHGRSMESEIRAILAEAVGASDEGGGLFLTLLDRVGGIGGVDLDLPRRSTTARAADLSS